MRGFNLMNSRLGREIYSDLWYNLNFWPRVEGNTRRGGSANALDCLHDADIHFYETALSDKRINRLTELTGKVYANWGEEHAGRWIGWKPNEFYSPLGLRWIESLDEWQDKQIRNQDKVHSLWRPQLIVTIRPIEVWHYFRTNRFLTKQGKTGSRFKESAIAADPRWQEKTHSRNSKKPFEIIPLKFVLRIKDHPTKNEEPETSIESEITLPDFNYNCTQITPKSRHYATDGHEQSRWQQRMDESVRQQIFKIDREVYTEFYRKG